MDPWGALHPPGSIEAMCDSRIATTNGGGTANERVGALGALDGACLALRPPGPGVCRTCCGPVRGRYEECWSCSRVERALSRRLHPVTAISLTTRATGLYAALKQYKAKPGAVSVRQTCRLAELTAAFLEHHSGCVAPGGFDVVAVVPSLRMGGEHPLAQVFRSVVADRPVVEALHAGASLVERDTARASVYSCRSELVENRRVLLVDDTYTTGAHLHSAAAALEDAGAANVHLMVVGRHQNPLWGPSRRLLDWAGLAENRWRPQTCARCPAGTR